MKASGARWVGLGGQWFTLVQLVMVGGCSVSEEREVAMGKEDAEQIESEMPVVHDSVVDRFITELGHSMASHTSRANLEWHFTVVNSPEVNAFALPGGFVFVNRGAIEQADRLDELAGVMGHEIGHVLRRHGVHQMKEAQRRGVGLLLLCTLTTACRTIGGRVAIDIGANALSAQYSQRDEAEADSEGVLNTVHAGIDPEGLPAFFQALLDQQKVRPDLVQAFFSTHPTDASRVKATERQIAQLDPAPGPNLVKDTPEFHAIQVRIRAFPPPPPKDSANSR
jgi:predicted Zn-dependent protease